MTQNAVAQPPEGARDQSGTRGRRPVDTPGAGLSRQAVRDGRGRHDADRRWVWSWVGSVTAGELAGFCVPLLAAAMVAQRPTTVLVPALVLAGTGEGAILGWSQARVLQRRCRRLSVPRWMGLTSLAAAPA
jgi:hypothetical protein